MPKPPTFLDYEIVEKIQAYFLDNSKFPTIAEVKRWGCGDTRAQTLLKTAKGFQPQPQPQPQPIKVLQPLRPEDGDIEVDYADFTGARWFYLLPGEFEKCPDWIKLRLKTL